MEIKLRRKGEIVFVQMPDEDFPEEFLEEQAWKCDTRMEGVDLTKYPVILVLAGRRGGIKAEAAAQRAPTCIVVYKYEWRNGWGSGVILPENFDPSRVQFYKPASQLAVEAKAAAEASMETLVQQINAQIPNVRASFGSGMDQVVVSPDQEVFSIGLGWEVVVDSLEDASVKIAAQLPFWTEWNRRGLEIYARYNERSPGKGNVQLHPCPSQYKKTVGISVGNRTWVYLAQQEDGTWLEQPHTFSSAPN